MSGCWVLSPPWDICSIPLRGHHGREDRKNQWPKGKGRYEFYEITQPSRSWWTHNSFSYPPRTCSRLGPSQGITDRLHPFLRSCWCLVINSNTSSWVQVWLFRRQIGYLSSRLWIQHMLANTFRRVSGQWLVLLKSWVTVLWTQHLIFPVCI